jgi:hypothetical protein
VISMRKPIIFVFILSFSLLSSFCQKASGQDIGKDQGKNRLTIEEHKLFPEKDMDAIECFQLECVPDNILEKRKKWRDLNLVDQINEQLKPLGYTFKRNQQDRLEKSYDFYKGTNLLYSKLSYIYGFSISSSKKRFLFNASRKDGGGLFLDGKLTDWEGWRPQFLGEEIIDVYSVENFPEKKYEYCSEMVKESKEQVRIKNRSVYEFFIVSYPFDVVLKNFYVHKNHWVLEYMNGKIKGGKVVDYPGTVVVDGVNLNKKHNFREIFNYIYLDNNPFYFYRDDSGFVKLSYGGEDLMPKYEKVMHYGCGSYAACDPLSNQNMIWFFGLKNGFWYYVEVGVYQ